MNPDRPRDPAGVRVEPAEAVVVQALFAPYLEERARLFGLAKHLQTLGLTSPCGKWRWNPATIRGILTNPAYTGQVHADRTRSRAPRLRRSATHPIGKPSTTATVLPRELWVPLATLPALVRQEQFDRVQAKLALNQPWLFMCFGQLRKHG